MMKTAGANMSKRSAGAADSDSIALRLDASALEDAVHEEFGLLQEHPPSREELANLEDIADVDELVVNMIVPLVKLEGAKAVLGAVRKRVDRVRCTECLELLDPVHAIGRGADGEVWKLRSGHAAKVGAILLDEAHEGSLPGWATKAAQQEVAAARAAGAAGLAPKVHDAWFCASPTRMAYVIVMDAVQEGVTLHAWKRRASEDERAKMRARIDALVVKMNALGIFHDDLHAGNVMVDDLGQPWIIDFSRCTYIKELRAYKSAQSEDLWSVQQSLSTNYMPRDAHTVARCILARLLDRKSVILVRNR